MKDPMNFAKLLDYLEKFYEYDINVPRVIQILPFIDNESYENI